MAVTNGGGLSAVGTADDRIAFVGANERRGTWEAVIFRTAESASTLDYVDILHAGRGEDFGFSGVPAAVIVESAGSVRISNSSIG